MPEQLAALGSSKIVNVIKNCKWKRALTNAQLNYRKVKILAKDDIVSSVDNSSS